MRPSNFIFQGLKPGIPKPYLLFVAGMVWTFAGGMLLWRGISMLLQTNELLWWKITASVGMGILFYMVVFSKLSLKHVRRIIRLQSDRPFLFAFFNLKSYLLMVVMMSFGIALRMTGIVPVHYLSFFYIGMGTPLFLSAFRFYYYGFNYQQAKSTLG